MLKPVRISVLGLWVGLSGVCGACSDSFTGVPSLHRDAGPNSDTRVCNPERPHPLQCWVENPDSYGVGPHAVIWYPGRTLIDGTPIRRSCQCVWYCEAGGCPMVGSVQSQCVEGGPTAACSVLCNGDPDCPGDMRCVQDDRVDERRGICAYVAE